MNVFCVCVAAWEVTMQQMEKDPKNIQYWRAAGDCSGSRGKDDA